MTAKHPANPIPQSCVDFEDRVNDLLDARMEIDEDAFLRRHANDCDQCRHWLAVYPVLTGATEVRPQPAKPSRRLRRPTALALTAVAMLVVGCLLMVRVPPPEPTVSLSSGQPPATEQLLAPEPDVGSISAADTVGLEPNATGTAQTFVSTNFGALDWTEFEKQIQSLQPVLHYSRRIPAVSSVHSTVDLALGWLRWQQADDVAPPIGSESTPDYGLWRHGRSFDAQV